MGFLKKFMLGFGALFFIFCGGAGTQSSSTLLQGGGFIGLVIGLVVLYIFAKMAWRAMGCLPSLLILLAVVFFILYAIGAFRGGLSNTPNNIRSFLGQGVQTSQEIMANAEQAQAERQAQNTANSEDGTVNLVGEDKHPILSENFMESFKQPKKAKKKGFNPMDYPSVSGSVRVARGDALLMSGRLIKIYGVAAPELSQTCADSTGRGYQCGKQSVAWLSGWLNDYEVKCHILSEDSKGVLTGVCMLGSYDIGAALINAGWAVADIRQSKIYVPYQNQAMNEHRGLWQGDFYMPWDWQKIQARKANIKVINQKDDSSRKHVWFSGLGF
jgi:endonuclease YncB( thermonuclease family)